MYVCRTYPRLIIKTRLACEQRVGRAKKDRTTMGMIRYPFQRPKQKVLAAEASSPLPHLASPRELKAPSSITGESDGTLQERDGARRGSDR